MFITGKDDNNPSAMNLMTNFNSARQAIYDHVGFVEDWVVYAIKDRTDMFWQISGGEVKYSDSMEKFNSDSYVDEIYTQRFYKKHVYRGDELTMVFVDTHTDANKKFFAIFSNKLEQKTSKA